MKLTSLFLILSFLFSTLAAQTTVRYEADLIVKKKSSADKKAVFISFENGAMSFVGKKDKNLNQNLQNSSIKIATYSFSDKPQIAEGIAASLAFGGIMGIPFFFTNKKKHWLAVSTENDGYLFELKKETYRQLLLEMNAQKIKIEDTGDRDYKPIKPRKNP